MVCCTVIAAMLALLTRHLMMGRPNPLAWRLGATIVKNDAAPRAGGRLQSVMHALDGIRFLGRNEPNMRIHLSAAALVVGAGIWIELDPAEWLWLTLAIALVLMAEALNTAVEQTCNAVSRKFDPAIKVAKDVAAGAVLISAIAAALIGAVVFVPHLSAAYGQQAVFYCGTIR